MRVFGTSGEDQTGIAAFRDLVDRLRTEIGLIRVELAERMGTTQSAIARMEGSGTRPTLDTLENLANAIEADLSPTAGLLKLFGNPAETRGAGPT